MGEKTPTLKLSKRYGSQWFLKGTGLLFVSAVIIGLDEDINFMFIPYIIDTIITFLIGLCALIIELTFNNNYSNVDIKYKIVYDFFFINTLATTFNVVAAFLHRVDVLTFEIACQSVCVLLWIISLLTYIYEELIVTKSNSLTILIILISTLYSSINIILALFYLIVIIIY